ncbi:radical SAM protein [Bradyrhizobium sp. 166]|uniref:radical SAM/SPASM domain-containing protein n=1 Tax=Bradyrhizobium sp. 166 TaxID=2782638 RepID=UPI001FF7F2AE|nr:radical SAM protein [Bradyrhizobium sp. 166]MCK1604754.1 radical SAM protein [Bradyrhizobium sp. 166]
MTLSRIDIDEAHEKGRNQARHAGSRPRSRHAHWQNLDGGGQLLVVNGSQIYDVDGDIIERLDAAAPLGDAAVERVLEAIGVLAPLLIDDTPLVAPPLYALSLAVAQKCNLGCTYCYAAQGEFGGAPKDMPLETALRSVQLLIDGAEPGARVNLAFLGGEPLTNRAVLRAATEHTLALAQPRGINATFSITTNGTLLTADDASFFERHGFAVTVSLDGLRDVHDHQRPFRNGAGSFDRIMERVRPLLAAQRKMQVSVRATVTPGNSSLRESLDYFLDLNFHSVGFSPVLHASARNQEVSAHDLEDFLAEMIECGAEFERRLQRGERYAFTNVINALREIHRGTHRPYPCGAGAGYLGVSADGDLAACHRFVGDEAGRMGNLSTGVDQAAQARWLAERHVHHQVPCRDCWARYLCAGGCHHEVIARGRPACDYIRGWLHYCLQAYSRISRDCPDWFDASASASA